MLIADFAPPSPPSPAPPRSATCATPPPAPPPPSPTPAPRPRRRRLRRGGLRHRAPHRPLPKLLHLVGPRWRGWATWPHHHGHRVPHRGRGLDGEARWHLAGRAHGGRVGDGRTGDLGLHHPRGGDHWWHAPIYIAATAALILAAMSSSSLSPGPPPPRLSYPLDLVAPDLILTLHRSGFHLSALLLQISAVRVSLPSSTNLTFLALPDRELAGIPSLDSALRLFRLHAIPLRLDFPTLARMPRGACIPTLLPGSHLHVTTRPSVSLDGVPVTHPDLFLAGPHVIHGVASRLDLVTRQDSCHVEEIHEAKAKIQWGRVVKALSSGGYESFALALGAVLDALRGEIPSVTVFAPRDAGFGYLPAGGGQLESTVRRHVAVGRYGYAELAGVGPAGMEVGTMEEGETVRVTVGTMEEGESGEG